MSKRGRIPNLAFKPKNADDIERALHDALVTPIERFAKRLEERVERFEDRIRVWEGKEDPPADEPERTPSDADGAPSVDQPLPIPSKLSIPDHHSNHPNRVGGEPAPAFILAPPSKGDTPLVGAWTGADAHITPPPPAERLKELWRSFSANKPAVVGLCIVALMFAVAAAAPLLTPFDMAIKQNVRAKFEPPSAAHWLGTDYVGRDVMARVLHGARVSLTMGFLPALCSIAAGMLLGSAAAYFGNWADNIIMRLCDIFHCIPGVLLSLAFVAALGPGLNNMLIAITISSIPSSTRFVRAVILNIVDKEYIEAARACGSSPARVILRHVLPNAIGPLILQTVSYIAGMIMTGAGLSFLGLGLQPPNPEWGYMLAEYQKYLRNAPYLMLAPGIAILIAVLAFNLMGDGLRDALDPKLRR